MPNGKEQRATLRSLCAMFARINARLSFLQFLFSIHEIADGETAEFGAIEGRDNSSVRGRLLARCEANIYNIITVLLYKLFRG